MNFVGASNLKVNLAKSKVLCLQGVPRARCRRLSVLSTIPMTSSIDKYLRVPLLHGRAKRHDFQFIVDKLFSKLSSWKHSLINRVERITLTKDVLSSNPVYSKHTMWLRQAVCSDIDPLIKKSTWKGNEWRWMHLVDWDTLTLPSHLGGLGIRRAWEANIAMLGELVWDVLQNSNKIFVSIMSRKYVSDQGSFLTHECPSKASFCWRSINKASNRLKSGWKWRVGDGSAISLWHDNYVEGGPLFHLVENIPPSLVNMSVADLIHNAS